MARAPALWPLAAAPWLLAFTFTPATPESQGLSSDALDELVEYSESIASKTGLLVLRHDFAVLERYTGGATATTKFAIKSATKSFAAGLLVDALGHGDLAVSDLVCASPPTTVWQVATHTSGIRKDDSSCDRTRWFPPGSDFGYSDGGVNVLRDALRAIHGSDLRPYLAQTLMDPIGIVNWTWDTGQPLSSGLSLSVRDLARYGRLWLRDGDWDGVQVLDPELVAWATSPSHPDFKPDYGVLWWVASDEPPPFYARYGYELNPVFPDDAPAGAFLAAGCTRSWILVVPSQDLVVARAGGSCLSIRSGTTQFTDEARTFVELALAAAMPEPGPLPCLLAGALLLAVLRGRRDPRQAASLRSGSWR